MENIFEFLNDLKENNNREWFLANKPRYESAKKTMESIAAKLIAGINEFDKSIRDINPKDTVFRIYRDVRFSPDKTPYKINIGSFIVKGGKKSNNAGYYFHIEPGNSFLGGGIHMPPADVLKKVRDEIYSNPSGLKNILDYPSFIEHFGQMDSDKLSRPPKGYDPGFEYIELLKFKSFTVGRNLSDEECKEKGLVSSVLGSFREMTPFLDFLNQAVDHSY